MRFMMMIKSDEQTEEGGMPDNAIVEAMIKYNDELVKAGALLAAEGLHPSSRGARVKFHGGKPTVTDGPFAEAKELVAGYWIIQAKSKQEAIDWALRCPGGQLEIRQLFELEDFPVHEEESGWREKEAEQRAQGATVNPVRRGWKQFVIFRMADKHTEAGAMPSEELLTAMGEYNEEMMKAGVLLSGEGFQPSVRGARIADVGGKRTVVDGPFTEAKELVAGFSLIQAPSKAEAIDWLKRWPALDSDGEVELRLREVFAADEFGEQLPPDLREAEERQRAQIAGRQ